MATIGELLSDRNRCSYLLIELIFAQLDLNCLHKAINVCIIWRNRGVTVRAQWQELQTVKAICAGCSMDRAHGIAPIPAPTSDLDCRLCVSTRSGLQIVSTVGAGVELRDFTASVRRMLAQERTRLPASADEPFDARGVATSAAGDVFCVDSFNHRVLIVPSPSEAAANVGIADFVGGRGSGPGQLLYPEAVALSQDAENGKATLLIADPINHRIVTMAEVHSLANSTPLPHQSLNVLNVVHGPPPMHIWGQNVPIPLEAEVDDDEAEVDAEFVVAQPELPRRFDFRWCSSFGGADDAINDHRLGDPRGLAVHDGHCYIADYGRCEVAVYTTGGTFLRVFGGRGDAPGQFEGPRGIAVVAGSWLVVTDQSSRLQVLTLQGVPRQEMRLAGESGPLWEDSKLWGVTASGRHVYVVDQGTERIIVLECRQQVEASASADA